MTTTTFTPAAPVGVQARGGPPLWLLAFAYTALMVAGVAVSAGLPRPSASAGAMLAYQRGHVGALQLAAFFQFGSAMPLAIWSATAYRRLRMLGVTVPGTAICFAGGLLAAGSLALGGLVVWTRAQTADIADPAMAKLLGQLSFALGGVGYAVPFALLAAGVAVPALVLRLLPRGLGWAGMVIAVIGVLAGGAILTPALDLALPAVRFAGVMWLIAVGFLLARTRPRHQPHA